MSKQVTSVHVLFKIKSHHFFQHNMPKVQQFLLLQDYFPFII